MKGRRLPPRLKWVFAIALVIVLGPPAYIYSKYSRMVDDRLKNGAFANTSNVYSASPAISPGDNVGPQETIAELRHAGYTESPSNALGYYTLNGATLEVHPGPDSFFSQE